MIESEPVRKKVGDPALEAVELAQAVLPEGDQEVRVDVLAVDGPRELRFEPVLAGVGRMVQEVLLELVEEEEERHSQPGPALERGTRPAATWGRRPPFGPGTGSGRCRTSRLRAAVKVASCQSRKTTTAERGSFLRFGTTPAIKTELLPTPLAP